MEGYTTGYTRDKWSHWCLLIRIDNKVRRTKGKGREEGKVKKKKANGFRWVTVTMNKRRLEGKVECMTDSWVNKSDMWMQTRVDEYRGECQIAWDILWRSRESQGDLPSVWEAWEITEELEKNQRSVESPGKSKTRGSRERERMSQGVPVKVLWKSTEGLPATRGLERFLSLEWRRKK